MITITLNALGSAIAGAVLLGGLICTHDDVLKGALLTVLSIIVSVVIYLAVVGFQVVLDL